MNSVAENLWVQTFRFSLLGMNLGKTTAVIRLRSGRTIIHSAAPFSSADVAEIRALGEPGWLLEATCVHDTFVREGRAAFPGIPYLVPAGFPLVLPGMKPLLPPPAEWADEVALFPLAGIPRANEVALLHRPSRSLIVADLLFNYSPDAGGFLLFFLRHVSGLRTFPGVSRLYRSLIRDRPAFNASIDRILQEDIDRIVVAHREVIAFGARDALRKILQA